jgi:hypothetical protein
MLPKWEHRLTQPVPPVKEIWQLEAYVYKDRLSL